MFLGLLNNVDGCMSDTPKVVHFGVSNTGATRILESPSECNLGIKKSSSQDF